MSFPRLSLSFVHSFNLLLLLFTMDVMVANTFHPATGSPQPSRRRDCDCSLRIVTVLKFRSCQNHSVVMYDELEGGPPRIGDDHFAVVQDHRPEGDFKFCPYSTMFDVGDDIGIEALFDDISEKDAAEFLHVVATFKGQNGMAKTLSLLSGRCPKLRTVVLQGRRPPDEDNSRGCLALGYRRARNLKASISHEDYDEENTDYEYLGQSGAEAVNWARRYYFGPDRARPLVHAIEPDPDSPWDDW